MKIKTIVLENQLRRFILHNVIAMVQKIKNLYCFTTNFTKITHITHKIYQTDVKISFLYHFIYIFQSKI